MIQNWFITAFFTFPNLRKAWSNLFYSMIFGRIIANVFAILSVGIESQRLSIFDNFYLMLLSSLFAVYAKCNIFIVMASLLPYQLVWISYFSQASPN